MSPGEQRILADGAQRWLALDGIGRAQANERWQTWRSLTPEQRERLQAMSPEEFRRKMNRRQGPKPGTEGKRPCPPC